MQRPSFIQGCGLHQSIFCSHRVPVVPPGQMQKLRLRMKPPFDEIHEPPFMHGEAESHGVSVVVVVICDVDDDVGEVTCCGRV